MANSPIIYRGNTAFNLKDDFQTTNATVSSLTINRALVSDGSSNIVHSAVTATELGYVSGVTSSIQTQINSLTTSLGNYVLKAGDTMTGDLVIDSGSGTGEQITLTGSNAAPGLYVVYQKTGTGAQEWRVGMNASGTNEWFEFYDATNARTMMTLSDTSNAILFGSQIQANSDAFFTQGATFNSASNQLVLGNTANTITINASAPAASRVYSLPDAGATADFVMTAGAQTIAGAKTFSNSVYLATSSGSVGIGTSSPGELFTASGTIKSTGGTIADSATAGVTLRYDTGAATAKIETWTSKPLDIQTGGASRLYISGTGNVGIGTASPGSNKVAISAVSATAQLAFGRTSTNQGHGVIGATATSAFELYTGGTATDAVLAGSALMSVTHAGAVTLGPSSGLTSAGHRIQAEINNTTVSNIGVQNAELIVSNTRTSAAGERTSIRFDQGGTIKAMLAVKNEGGSTGSSFEFYTRDSSNVTQLGLVVGQTGAVTLGPQYEIGFNMESAAGISNVTSALLSNCKQGSNRQGRNLSTRSGGGVLTAAQTTNGAGVILFYGNQVSDAAGASAADADLLGLVSAEGAWTLGPSGFTGDHNFNGNVDATKNVNGGADFTIRNTDSGAGASAGFVMAANGGTGFVYKTSTGNSSAGGADTLNIINETGGVYLSPGATSWSAISDMRHKEKVSDFGNVLGRIGLLDVFTYQTIESKKAGKSPIELGLSAQQMIQVAPEIVTGSEETKYGISYERLSVVLVKAIQELKAELDTLKAQLP